MTDALIRACEIVALTGISACVGLFTLAALFAIYPGWDDDDPDAA